MKTYVDEDIRRPGEDIRRPIEKSVQRNLIIFLVFSGFELPNWRIGDGSEHCKI